MKYYLLILLFFPSFFSLSYEQPSAAEHMTITAICYDPTDFSGRSIQLRPKIELNVGFHDIVFMDNEPIGGFYYANILESQFEWMKSQCSPRASLKAWVDELKQNVVFKLEIQESTNFKFSKPLVGFQCKEQCRTSYTYFSLFNSLIGLDDPAIHHWINTVGDMYTIDLQFNEGDILTKPSVSRKLIINQNAVRKTYISTPEGMPTFFTPLRLLIRATLDEAYENYGLALSESELIQKTNQYLPMIGHPRRDRMFNP